MKQQTGILWIIGCLALCFWTLNQIAFTREDESLSSKEKSLIDLSLEELMNIEITSVSKRKQKLSEAAAAVYVITQEDVRRSGATSVAEALRMVPGVQVARVNSNQWAIGVRGFNGQYSNKLLVLIDGRSVYSPLYSGVYWDIQDVILEDIERIEVIRGPGASLWGANALNGVINIITKHAKDTQGGLISAGAGNEERGFGTFRYGGKNGDLYYRIYSKYFNRDKFVDSKGNNTADDWDLFHVGFRTDWDISEDNMFTFQGELYNGKINNEGEFPDLLPPYLISIENDDMMRGGNLLGRWTNRFSDTSDLSLQIYYDRNDIENRFLVNEIRDTFDIDFQNTFLLSENHTFTWGLGYRYTQDEITDYPPINIYNPKKRGDNIFSTFVQDEINLIDELLVAILGIKLEYNDYTGFEYQPSGRLILTPDDKQSIWVSVSRAVRTPSRAEDNLRTIVSSIPPNAMYPGSPLAALTLFGNSDVESEELISYELGYRHQLTEKLSLDIAVYYNDYEDIIIADSRTPYMETGINPPHFVIPLVFENDLKGNTYGGELSVNWHVTDRWKLSANYSYLDIDLSPDETVWEGEVPQNQFSISSYLDLPHNLEFNSALYYVDNLSTGDIPNYIRVDAGLIWHPTEQLELSVFGQNLFDDRHPEFTPTNFIKGSEPERSIYGKVTWKF